MTEHEATEEPTKRGKLASLRGQWSRIPTFLQGLILFVVVAVVIALVSIPIGAARAKSGAIEACEDLVTSALKSPASAVFSNVEASKSGEYGYFVTGDVDSQNGFGAMLRNGWTCRAQQIGDEWLVIDADFDED